MMRFRSGPMFVVALALAALPAVAQEKKTLVISMWGYNGDKLEAHLFKPFRERNNVDIVLEPGNSADRLNKVKIRRGGVDLIYLPDSFSQIGIQDGLFEPIDRARIPNIETLYAAAQAPNGKAYGPGYTVGRYGVIYDSAKVTAPITAWGDLWRPEFKQRLSLPGFATTAGPLTVLVAAARRKVDPFTDTDAAFASLAELKPNLLKTYNTGSELVNLFSTGEIVVAAAQDFTFGQIKAAVPTARWAELSDGAFANFNTVNVVKGTKDKELAQRFIDWHLSAEVQKALAIAGTDAPASTKAELTPEQAAPWTYGEAMIGALHTPDYAKVNAAKADWSDRWNEVFGR